MATHIPTTDGRLGDLIHHISDDVKTIARGELELARLELTHVARSAAADAAVILLGAIVALIGLGMMCVAAVVALAPVIEPLWLRLLLFAAVYVVLGGLMAATFAKRLQTDASPNLGLLKAEARLTARDVARGLRH